MLQYLVARRIDAIAISLHMKDLYDRLLSRGFDRAFLQRAVLPDWWDDKLAAEPANRAIAEAAVSRNLGFPIKCLSDPAAVLPELQMSNFKLKRNKNVQPQELKVSAFVSQRIMHVAVQLASAQLPAFQGAVQPEAIRKSILESAAAANLQSLVEFAWGAGVVVIHLKRDLLPTNSKHFDGAALFCGSVPVVILSSKKDGPPWLAFHLAHELGHIYLGHVKPNDPPLFDSDIQKAADDEQEKQADAFANIVLTGQSNPSFVSSYRLTGEKLANGVVPFGKQHGVDPGTAALVYARTQNMWGPGQIALQRLGLDKGAHAILGKALAKHVDVETATESALRFLSCLSMDC